MTGEEVHTLNSLGDLVMSRIYFNPKEIAFVERLQGLSTDKVLSKKQKAWLKRIHGRWYFGNKAIQQNKEVHAQLNPDYRA